MSAHYGYAGFRRPADIVSDNVLSDKQKTETLLHWKRAVARLMPFASDDEREAYRNLTIELAAALTHIDIVPVRLHSFETTPLKTTKP
ncbi:hypothetical protein K32_02220 [Kaistia sp. 32K]|uniref:hypothetical protein n=1 Tax=Kaistia sp. 32K TaxID=2795690 RepID=UPI00191590C9|nr:hypothetical protein [Kaistia sp. 32K]BCP51605.1 hypothetical protein K32_02220 [Kaistia sp. 32K]